MSIMDISSAVIMLLGGLAMFLYGIDLMGDGLKNSSSAALKRVLEKVTGNVVMGVITGTLVTAVIQSSSATIVLTVALVGAGVLNLKQAVSIAMGANIGTTVTAQIIRLGAIDAGDNWFLWLFDTDTLAPLALLVGIILLMFVKKKSAKPIGDICIGFGILFTGLDLMTSGVEPLVGTAVFEMFLDFLSNPLFGILFGLVLTMIVQSSSATVGMLQTVAQSAAASGGAGITFAMAYPVIMGINLGTCITTAMVCSIGNENKDSRRVGVTDIACNAIGAVVFMVVMSILQANGVWGAEFWQQTADSGIIANFQTMFNLLSAVLLIPFTSALVKLSLWVIPEDKEQPQRHPELHTLDEKLYISPAIAVSEASKAIAAMGQVATDNFARGCKQLLDYREEDVAQILEEEDCLDQFTDASDRFLIGLSKVVEQKDEDLQVDMLLQTAPNFERIGDYATNLMELGQRAKEEGHGFSMEAKEELNILISAVNEILQITVDAFAAGDTAKARTVEPLEETIDDMVVLLRKRHTQRLKNGLCSISTGLAFVEALTHLERAADQCSSIALMMLGRENEQILLDHHEYLRQLHGGTDEAYAQERERRRQQYLKPFQEQ